MKKSIYILITVFLLAACNNQHPKDKHQTSLEPKKQMVETTQTVETKQTVTAIQTATEIVTINDNYINAVYQHYQKLSFALTEGDVTAAKIAAAAIETGAQHIPAGKTLAAIAGKIIVANDIESQRTSYAALSNNFISIIKRSGLASGELYIAHCPMALSDAGARWLSSHKEIRNPYFGHQMLNCGSVQEKVKAGKS